MSNTLKFGNGQWATKVGSTLAYNDEGGNFKPLPFNFTRSTGGTRVNKDGLIEVVTNNKPRIDFLNDSNGALLLEPTRSNLYTYSEDFSNGSWTKSIATVTLTSEIAPDGTNDSVYSFVGVDANLYTNTQSTGSEYTISFYFKSNGNGKDVFKLRLGSNFSQVFTATNEWVRYTFNATANSQVFGISSNDIDSDILIWGAQLEAGSYATSYIPTQGAVATRVAEVCSQTPPSGIIGQTEGSVYVEVNISNTTSKTIFALDTGSASNFIILDTSSSLSPKILVRQSNGSFPSIITGTTMNYGVNKIAFCYKSGDYAMYVNGTLSGTSASATFPSGVLSQITVGANPSYGFLSDSVNDLKIYNTRLSNAELQSLTSN